MADAVRGFSEDEFSTALAEALRYFKYDFLKVEQTECIRRVRCFGGSAYGFREELNLPNIIIPKMLECLKNESDDTQNFIVCVVSPLEYIRRQQVASINKLHGLSEAAVGDNEKTDKDIEMLAVKIPFSS